MRTPVLLLGALAVALCQCANGPAVSPQPANGPDTKPAPPPVAAAPVPEHRLKRSAIHAAIVQGLGAFLQHADLDDAPVRVDGHFRGFRIAGLRDPPFWAGVDLKPGDVVTRVNGFPIERPEQAQTAFESLEVASELRVSYERNGEPRELVYPIVEDH
jgi:type II secretory pathway component PulC